MTIFGNQPKFPDTQRSIKYEMQWKKKSTVREADIYDDFPIKDYPV